MALLGATCGASRAGADPGVTFDLRVRGTGAKEAAVQYPGDTVTLDLYAIVSGADADPTNEGFISAIGSLKSSFGGLLGELRGLAPVAPFNGVTSSAGLRVDLDGDGDLDVGGTDPSNPAGYYAVRAVGGDPVYDQPAGGFRVGQVRITVGANIGSLTTDIGYVPRPFLSTTLPMIDGVVTSIDGTSSMLHLGTPVTIRGNQVITGGPITYLSGSVTQHLNVEPDTTVRASSALTLDGGITVRAGGVFEGYNAQGIAQNVIVNVNDSTSGNEGGRLHATSMSVGRTGAGRFTHTGGLTRVLNGLTIGSVNAGTVTVSAGTLSAGSLSIARGGDATLVVSGSGMVSLGTVTGGLSDKRFTCLVSDDAILELNGTTDTGMASLNWDVRQSGGTVSLPAFKFETQNQATYQLSGGRLLAQTLSLGTDLGNGKLVQSGGTLSTGRLTLGGQDQHQLSGGTCEAEFAYVNSGLSQTGGLMRPLTLTIASGAPDDDALGYHLSGGTFGPTHAYVGGPVAPPNASGPFDGFHGQLDVSGAGNATVDTIDVAYHSVLRFRGGDLMIRKAMAVEGTLDFANTAVTLHAGDGSFVDFGRTGVGTIANSANASIVAGVDSLLNFPAGFDPFAGFASIDTQGLIHVNGQPLAVPQGRTVSGSGAIDGDVTNHGKISPGNSAGQIALLDDYSQDSTALLEIEIGGRASELYDVLSIAGAASLDGLLSVNLIDDFVPLASDSFTFLTADGGILGRFANAPADQVYFPGGRFDLTYSINSVTLSNFTAVPEPTVSTVVAVVLTGLRRRARRCDRIALPAHASVSRTRQFSR